jgi:hypothetical protein
VSNCPGHPEHQTSTTVITSIIAISTTVCPVTESSTPASCCLKHKHPRARDFNLDNLNRVLDADHHHHRLPTRHAKLPSLATDNHGLNNLGPRLQHRISSWLVTGCRRRSRFDLQRNNRNRKHHVRGPRPSKPVLQLALRSRGDGLCWWREGGGAE